VIGTWDDRSTAATPLAPLVEYTLGLGDDALVLAQRLGEWIASGPQIEEDMALANIGLDLLGQARALLSYAGELEGAGRDEDALAYLRDERDFRNLQIVERPNGDFAVTVARQLAFAAYQYELYERLKTSADATLAAIAAKAVKEVAYHRDHATQWVLRLGDGTDESHRRAQEAIDQLWAFTGEMFETDDSERGLIDAGIAVDPASLRASWLKTVSDVVSEATLALPKNDWMQQGGRSGRHSEHLGHLLSELQSMPRTFPGATW
jgi:ring-1,2-phenylacetyl-CoA epoxidase subunit PaaC